MDMDAKIPRPLAPGRIKLTCVLNLDGDPDAVEMLLLTTSIEAEVTRLIKELVQQAGYGGNIRVSVR
jgi:hypothetical protein